MSLLSGTGGRVRQAGGIRPAALRRQGQRANRTLINRSRTGFDAGLRACYPVGAHNCPPTPDPTHPAAQNPRKPP
jgi:hypothetical protein